MPFSAIFSNLIWQLIHDSVAHPYPLNKLKDYDDVQLFLTNHDDCENHVYELLNANSTY